MKQKIGPFKFEVPAQIIVEQMQTLQSVRLRVSGKDKFTATTINVLMDVLLSADQTTTKLQLHADLQIAGRLATLGYPVIKKKSVDLFNEFEARLRALLEIH
jgi:carbon monoxide dehydrogenase subunit G